MTDLIETRGQSKRPLILASKSPRRQELLQLCGESFTVITADLDEAAVVVDVKEANQEQPFDLIAVKIVMALAKEKALKVLEMNPEAVIIGADTIVTIDEKILGKPASEAEAYEMLHQLSGRKHSVLTGVSILSKEKEETFYTCAKVCFYPWDSDSEELVKRYIATGSPFDKAGGYGIQDMGALLVERIEGDFYTVMGLPVAEVYRYLKKFR